MASFLCDRVLSVRLVSCGAALFWGLIAGGGALAEGLEGVSHQEPSASSSPASLASPSAVGVPVPRTVSDVVPVDRLVARPPLVEGGKVQRGEPPELSKNGNGNGNGHDKAGYPPRKLAVRLPLLPNPSITAEAYGPLRRPRMVEIFAPASPVPQKIGASPVPSPSVVPLPSPSPVDRAAVAAFTAYKKRQLDAIESDRETLAALQAAIAELGLQEKLSFIPQQIVPSQVKPLVQVTPSPVASPSGEGHKGKGEASDIKPRESAIPSPLLSPSPLPSLSPSALPHELSHALKE